MDVEKKSDKIVISNAQKPEKLDSYEDFITAWEQKLMENPSSENILHWASVMTAGLTDDEYNGDIFNIEKDYKQARDIIDKTYDIIVPEQSLMLQNEIHKIAQRKYIQKLIKERVKLWKILKNKLNWKYSKKEIDDVTIPKVDKNG